MSSSSIPCSAAVATDALLVRDVDGQYRPALAEEVLSHARRVLAHRVRRVSPPDEYSPYPPVEYSPV